MARCARRGRGGASRRAGRQRHLGSPARDAWPRGLPSDLYQRLAVFVIDVPPLRERRSDISPLAARFLADLDAEVGPRELCPAPSRGCAYAWPGNVRELRNVLYRAALDSHGRLSGGANRR